MKSENYVFLTGGLGNQLFQIVAGMNSVAQKIFIVPNPSNARKSKNLKLDIEELDLGPNIQVLRTPGLWKISLKGINYVLRTFAQKLPAANYSIIDFLSIFTLTLILALNLRKWVQIVPNRGLGKDLDVLKNSRKTNFYIGYFQSFIYSNKPEVMNTLRNFRPRQNLDSIAEYKKLSELERPLIVHVRMGDYKDSEGFGILPKEYYATGIKQLWEKGIFGSIWLFSDEPEKALSRIPDELRSKVRVVTDYSDSATTTLEIMKEGFGYVIANSSFSWWAATLRYRNDSPVICPDVWFHKSDSPDEITNPDWIRINAWK